MDDERKPLVINASDIAKLPRTFFHGEHGPLEDDPDIFRPTSIGITRNSPAITVKADPDGAVLNTARLRTELGIHELDELVLALEEARTYLETHQK